jgi:dTDP-4-dehydrorhamnose reductase
VLETCGIDFVSWNRSKGSVSDESFVSNHVGTIKPSIIVNCAAWTDVDGAESDEAGARLVNADAVGYLAAAAKSAGAVFAHVSTDYVFSGVGDVPWSESGEKNPLSAYGRTKAAGEDLIAKIYPERSYIFRTAWLYSAHGKNFAKTMVKLALRDEANVSVVNDQIGQPTLAGDLAKQIIDSVATGIPFGVYHGTNSGQASWFDFAQEIFHLVGADADRVKPVGSDAYPRPAKRPTYSVLGHDKWVGSGVGVMRDWKTALTPAMPAILSTVKAEG